MSAAPHPQAHEADALDLAAVAAETGVHYDTLRKNWRAWADPTARDYCAFPAPFLYPPPGRRGALKWRASAIAEWKRARERAFGARGVVPPTYRHEAAADAAARRGPPTVLRQRATLARLMERS